MAITLCFDKIEGMSHFFPLIFNYYKKFPTTKNQFNDLIRCVKLLRACSSSCFALYHSIVPVPNDYATASTERKTLPHRLFTASALKTVIFVLCAVCIVDSPSGKCIFCF